MNHLREAFCTALGLIHENQKDPSEISDQKMHRELERLYINLLNGRPGEPAPSDTESLALAIEEILGDSGADFLENIDPLLAWRERRPRTDA